MFFENVATIIFPQIFSMHTVSACTFKINIFQFMQCHGEATKRSLDLAAIFSHGT